MIITDLTGVPKLKDTTIWLDGETELDIHLMLDKDGKATTDLHQAAWMLGEDAEGETVEVDAQRSYFQYVEWH